MELLTKEQLDERLAKIKEVKAVLKGLEDEVKEHTILSEIKSKYGEIELMTDVVQYDNGKRYVLADMETQMRYNSNYHYPNIYGYQVKKDLTLSVRCIAIWAFYGTKIIGKLEDLQNG